MSCRRHRGSCPAVACACVGSAAGRAPRRRLLLGLVVAPVFEWILGDHCAREAQVGGALQLLDARHQRACVLYYTGDRGSADTGALNGLPASGTAPPSLGSTSGSVASP